MGLEPRPMSVTPAVEAVGLHKSFGPVRAVDGIDLVLEPGRIYGLLGPNGSGKTTLIRLLIGLARPTAGSARLLGHPVPSREAFASVGYMPQGEAVYLELSVLENMRFFAALQGATAAGAIDDALALVELSERTGTPAHQLSGGMRRRLSLACAIVHRPPVLVLDEPSVGVDPALRVQFWGHFRRLAGEGTTILVASHVMDEADRCDELLFIRDGRAIARGSGAALRREAGVSDLEAAFLRFAGLGADGSPGAAGGEAAHPGDAEGPASRGGAP